MRAADRRHKSSRIWAPHRRAHLKSRRSSEVVLRFSAMSTSRRTTQRPSRDQVRAWLTTVIAPMASALAVEESRAIQRNWSFRCPTQDFEFLWPIRKMVAVPYLPNPEQLLRYRNELKGLADLHDRTLETLGTAARTAYDRVLHNERFRALAASTGMPDSEHEYLAEYVVNGLRDLAPHYSHHDVWNRHGPQFLNLRKDPALSNEFSALEEIGRSFEKSVKSLLTAVSTLQGQLSDTYKLPPVDQLDASRV